MPKIYQHLATFGSYGTGNGQFNFSGSYGEGGYYGGIAIDANYIYVADTGNNRVQVFNKSTYAYVGQFGSYGAGNGQFNVPADVTVDASYIYVLDVLNARVQRFNKSTYAFDMVVPSGISGVLTTAIANDGTRAYVLSSDTGNYLVRRILLTGGGGPSYEGYDYIGLLTLCDFVVDPTYYYVARTTNYSKRILRADMSKTDIGISTGAGIALDAGCIYQGSRAGHVITSNDLTTLSAVDYFGALGNSNGYFNAPGKIEYYDNKIYAIDSGNHRVQVFDYATLTTPDVPNVVLSEASGQRILVDW